jgi:two-component system sensor histidine kinase HupT/HoxJ
MQAMTGERSGPARTRVETEVRTLASAQPIDASPAPPQEAAIAQRLEGVDESTWLDVIHKMEEVYQQLLADEVALEEKNAELEQQQQFIFSLLSSMSDVLVATDHEGRIEETNAALRELVGKGDEALRGERFAALIADDLGLERLKTVTEPVAARHAAATIEIDLVDRHGQRVPVDFNITPRLTSAGRRVGHVFVGRPMGELKRAYHQQREAHEALKRTQQQLLHSEKMASLGRLVAGVAHELNNPISFVLGNVHALQRYADRLRRYVAAVHAGAAAPELAALRRELRIDHTLADLPSLMEGTLEGAQRTADIVAGLKRFSAVDREERAAVDLRGVVERAIVWVRKGTAPGFRIDWQPPAEPLTVRGRAGPLMQVTMNLIQNAVDATAGRTDARLVITAERDDHRVQLRFADNGPGIDAQALPRVFDPFFTTKPVGQGTGLGLSISYGIVDQHGGRLEAGNAPEGGAVFTLELPLAA